MNLTVIKAFIYCGLEPIESERVIGPFLPFIYAEIKKNDGRVASIFVNTPIKGEWEIKAMCNKPSGGHEAKIEFPTLKHLKEWVESHKGHIVSGLLDWSDCE